MTWKIELEKGPSFWIAHSILFIFLQEYPFFTMKTFPPGFLVHIGGVVSARSVKLLDRIHNPGEI